MPEHLSKYAAKLERRRTAQTLSAIDLAVRITEKEIEPPKASAALKPGSLPQPKTPHSAPAKKKHELADFDEDRKHLAHILEEATEMLAHAEAVAQQMVEGSASPYQANEPRGIWQFCMATKIKVEGMSKRAYSIPSRKAAQ